MLALAVAPGLEGSLELIEMDDPDPAEGAVLVEALALGICGTDHEIAAGAYGEAPAGSRTLVIGHESLGRVIEAPEAGGLRAGEHVVGIVRRPDPEPCIACASGEWDMCRNGRYTERGIKGLHGYGSQRWRIEPEFAVPVDRSLGLLGVLLEPASVVAKAWEQVERISARAVAGLERVLITGAGPIGLLAAMLAQQRGLEVHVLDLAEEGPKPDAVRALGATYHSGGVAQTPCPDAVIECTGVAQVVLDAIAHNRSGGIVCLTGVSSGGHTLDLDVGGLNRRIVLENDVVFGSVNANRRHYEQAHAALLRAPREWLERLVTRTVPLEDWSRAMRRDRDDIKVVVDFG